MKRALLLALVLLACDKEKEKEKRPEPGEKTVAAVVAPSDAGPAKLEKFELPEVRIAQKSETTVKIMWRVPAGTAVNDDAPFRVRWNRSDGLAEAPPDAKSTGSAVNDGFSIKVKPMPGAPNPTLGGEVNLVVCDATNHSVCLPVRREIELGFVAVSDAAPEVRVEMPLPAAR